MPNDTTRSKLTLVSDNGEQQVQLKTPFCVLVVDDEPLMREVTDIMIEENGGSTYLAADGDQAVKLFTKHKDEIDFVFMDFSMPIKNGYEAYLEIKKINPNVGVVFASGLRAIKEVEELVAAKEIEFITKPFHEIELLKALIRLQEKKEAQS
ncbi:MAG: response regulator [Bdellovibrionales bacterium]|nr:response regulator [Bdellovibrionales bacterium]